MWKREGENGQRPGLAGFTMGSSLPEPRLTLDTWGQASSWNEEGLSSRNRLTPGIWKSSWETKPVLAPVENLLRYQNLISPIFL